MSTSSSNPPPPPFQHALLAGGIAGTTVDLSLFPLDTLKTRLQSSAGFFPSGGFSGVYRGIGSAVVGSAPGAAFFFVTYESAKKYLAPPPPSSSSQRQGADAVQRGGLSAAGTHMLAASLGEVAACAVRVPTEVVKQRAQAGHHSGSSLASLRAILSLRQTHGLATMWRELYRGWGITIFREVPFTVIQFPIWEALKDWSRRRKSTDGQQQRQKQGVSEVRSSGGGIAQVEVIGAWESGLYGSMAGAVAAALTTPLDVLKTRVMLSEEKKVSVLKTCSRMMKEEGWRPFFAGITPRVTWISIGGAVFLGSYQWAINSLGSL